MNSKSKLILPLMGVVLLSSCANTTVFPEGDNKFKLVATSSEERYAENAAIKKATEYCQKQGKQVVVLSHKSEYQGVDKSQKAIIGLASSLLTDSGNPASSEDDYRVEVRFACK